MLTELWNRLRDRLSRDRLTGELDEELRFHRAQLERDGRASGMAAGDAGRAAARMLGNSTQLKERARDIWSFGWVDDFLSDLRYALRGIRKSPGFTIAVVITLALGVGANAAMFGVIDRLMFRPLAYLQAPSQVNRVYLKSSYRGSENTSSVIEYTRYLDLRKWTSSFSAAAAFRTNSLAVGTGDALRDVPVSVVSASYFDFFSARPVIGRFFTAAEDSLPKGSAVAVLSNAEWKSRYGGHADVLGKTLQVGAVVYEIIGVAPENFSGPQEETPAAVFIPITTYAGAAGSVQDRTTYFRDYSWGWMEMMVRRKPGVTREAASADLSAAYIRSWNAERAMEPSLSPADSARPSAIAGSMKLASGPDPEPEMKTLVWVGAVSLIVLLIACANVANLLLTRALRRRREIAVRLALGVTRRRLIAQCLTESLVLSVLGVFAGLLVAQWGSAALKVMLTDPTSPIGMDVGVLNDSRTLLFATAVACIVGLATGMAPAFYSRRSDLAAALKAGAREGSHQRSKTRTALLVFQGALSVVLLVGAGLFVRSLSNVKEIRLGFDPDPVLFVSHSMRGMELSPDERLTLGRRLLSAAQGIHGVESAATVSSVPFWSSSSTSLYVTGIDSVRKLGRFTYQETTAQYFQTMGTRIIRGRGFTDADRAGAGLVTVVSERMAAKLWPKADAVGQCIRIRADTMPCTTVVGIAENIKQNSLTDDGQMQYYVPIEQFRRNDGIGLFLHVRGDPALLAEPIRKQLQLEMPGASYITVMPLKTIIDPRRLSWMLGATMFTAFGGLALVLAAIGLYSVIAYNVAQRAHEMGVRVALGARTKDVVSLVVGEGARVAIAGVAIGCLLALAMGRAMQPMLYKVSPRDPLVFAGVAGMLLLAALVASFVPAIRASRADPNQALRAE